MVDLHSELGTGVDIENFQEMESRISFQAPVIADLPDGLVPID